MKNYFFNNLYMSQYIPLPNKPFNIDIINNLVGGQNLEEELAKRRAQIEPDDSPKDSPKKDSPTKPKQLSIKELNKKCEELKLNQEQCLALRSEVAEQFAVTNKPEIPSVTTESPNPPSHLSVEDKENKEDKKSIIPSITETVSSPEPLSAITIEESKPIIEKHADIQKKVDCTLQIDQYLVEMINELFTSFDKKDTFNKSKEFIDKIKIQFNKPTYDMIIGKINNYETTYQSLKDKVKNLDGLKHPTDWANLVKDIIFVQNEVSSFKCLQWMDDSGKRYSRI